MQPLTKVRKFKKTTKYEHLRSEGRRKTKKHPSNKFIH